MKTGSDKYPAGMKRGYRRTQDVLQAYRALFSGTGTKEEAEVVLTDLAETSGYYQVTGPDMSSEAVRYSEGQRSVFAHIMRALRMSQSELKALEEAARREAVAVEQEVIGP